MCFLKAGGSGMRDTTRVRLVLQGGRVSGDMEILLFEKDSRRGSLNGTIDKEDIIRVQYRFMQEGMQDTIRLEFRLTENALLQRPTRVDPASGREVPDPGADFGNKLDRIGCG